MNEDEQIPPMTDAEAREIIQRWMGSSPFHPDTIEAYMAQVAKRAKTFGGVHISSDDPPTFVRQVRGMMGLAKAFSEFTGES